MAEAILLLEDGTVFRGRHFGALGRSFGEVVFNTAMTGYQEVLTDPSYAGQIVTMTYPLVGNYGVNSSDGESSRPQVRGFVVREDCPYPSNWRAEQSLDAYLAENGVVGIARVDTRALTRRLRSVGTMRGVVSCLVEDLASPLHLLPAVQGIPLNSPDLVSSVTTPRPYHLPGSGFRVVALDFGMKRNILRLLSQAGCDLYVLPSCATPEDVLSLEPDGVFLSNGPGDPKDVPQAIATVRQLLGHRPIFGICLGHQFLGLALGGDTYKLKFGHRGANHPVKELRSGRVYITSQNHGYALRADSLPPDVEVSHLNLNDGTVEGLCHRNLPVFSVQYHPEAAPGPQDSGYLLGEFMRIMKTVAA